MKRIFKLFLVILTGFFFVSTLSVKANDDLVTMNPGASIRTAVGEVEQGLRFYGYLDETVKDNPHGFYLIYGEATPQQLEDALVGGFVEGETKLNGKEVFKVTVPGVIQDKDGKYQFTVVLTGIPATGYLNQITVIAYVEDNGAPVYVEEPTTRSIYDVAKAMQNSEDEDERNLADSIIDEIDFVTDAEILYDFTDLEGEGTSLNETTLGNLLADEYFDSVSDLDRVYDGGDASHVGMLKLGATSNNGSFKLILKPDVLIKTIVFHANGWIAFDKLIVNGELNNLSLIKNDRLVVVLEDETNEITIESNRRALIYKLELYGEDIIVPATEYVTVTFDYDCVEKENETVTIVKGDSVDLIENPVRVGYEFLGWFIDDSLYEGEALFADTTIKAHWEEIIHQQYVDDAVIVYDFKGLTGTGTVKDVAFWNGVFAN